MLLLPTRVLVKSRSLAHLIEAKRQENHLVFPYTLAYGRVLDDAWLIEAVPFSKIDIEACERFFLQLINNSPTAYVVEAMTFVEQLNGTFTLNNLIESLNTGKFLIADARESCTIANPVECALNLVSIAADLDAVDIPFLCQVVECLGISEKHFSIADKRKHL